MDLIDEFSRRLSGDEAAEEVPLADDDFRRQLVAAYAKAPDLRLASNDADEGTPGVWPVPLDPEKFAKLDAQLAAEAEQERAHKEKLEAPAQEKPVVPAPPVSAAAPAARPAQTSVTSLLMPFLAPPSAAPTGPAKPPAGGGPNLQRELLKNFDQKAQHTQELTDAQVLTKNTEGALRMQEAERQEAEAKKREDAIHQQEQDARGMLQGSTAIDDALRNGQIEPHRAWDRANGGQKFLMVLGGILGGFIPGVNQLMRQLDLDDEQEVERQKEAYQRGQQSLKNRDSLYNHLVQQHNNANLAAMQVLDLRKAAKEQMIKGQIEALGTEEAKAQGKLLLDELGKDRMQLQQRMANEAMAAAASMQAAREKAEERLFQRAKDVSELALKGRSLDLQERQEQGKEKKLTEDEEAQREVNSILDFVNKADAKELTAGSWFGTAASASGLATTGARMNYNKREAYNNGVKLAIGAAYKMQTGGVEPRNPHFIEDMAAPFEIKPTDNEAVANQKRELLKTFVLDAGKAKGVVSPEAKTQTTLEKVQKAAPGVKLTNAPR